LPYIKPEERPQFDRLLHTLARRIADNPEKRIDHGDVFGVFPAPPGGKEKP